MSADEPNRTEKDREQTKGEGRGGEAKGKPRRKPLKERPVLVGILVLVAIAAVVAGGLGWRHSRSHESTDDAYIDIQTEAVSPQVAGRVARVLVDDNQDVIAGQALVELDPADYLARLDQARAVQAQAQAQLAEAQAQRVVYEAQVEKARADLGTAQANSLNASNELKRYRSLRAINSAAVSAQQMDSAVAAATSASAQLNAAQRSVEAALAQVGYARSLVTAAQAGIGSANSQARQAQLTLSYTRILSRVDGRIASLTVAAGNVVNPGTPLMSVVPKNVYVTANFKETQLKLMRPGQPVRIQVDSYPQLELTGRVNGIQPATGQALSLLPAQNATGNWVKVVQRVPVKVTFDHLPDDPALRLAPGMSVEVSVAVR